MSTGACPSTKKRRLCILLAILSSLMAFTLVNHYHKRYAISQRSMPKVYEERIARIRETCVRSRHQYNDKKITLQHISYRPHLYFSDKYKILVCNVPKSGSTQWRQFLVQLESNQTHETISQSDYVNEWPKRNFWIRHNISTRQGSSEAEQKVNQYFRVMTVREPLERLVSAYKDKFENTAGDHRAYFRNLSKEIHKKYGHGSTGYATFSEFIDSILDEDVPKHLHPHFQRFTDNCDPCILNFDIVAKLETIQQDFSFIRRTLKINEGSAFAAETSERLNNKWTSSYHDYYKRLTKLQRLRIFEYYKDQYDYFGYPYPDYI